MCIKKKEIENRVNNIDEDIEVEEWELVEGYIKTDFEMKIGDCQLEFNKEFDNDFKDIYPEIIETLKRGYRLNKDDRFFKVKYLKRNSPYCIKNIKILEEIDMNTKYKDMIDEVCDFYWCSKSLDRLNSLATFVNDNTLSLSSFYDLCNYNMEYLKDRMIKELHEDYGYSKTFCIVLFDNFNIRSLQYQYEQYEKAIALADEKVSPDMRAYLLLKERH